MKTEYITTNIRLPVPLWKKAKKTALQKGISLSEFFRNLTRQSFGESNLASEHKEDHSLLENLLSLDAHSGKKDTVKNFKKTLLEIRLKQNKMRK